MIVVPHEQIEPQTLRALIEEFVTRCGAVHGHGDVALDRQVEDVIRQLRSGMAVIVYDEESESCTIASRDSLNDRDPSPEPRVVED